jgi:DNA-binding response OmpR family regulator
MTALKSVERMSREDLEEELAWRRSEMSAANDDASLAAVMTWFDIPRTSAQILMCLAEGNGQIVSRQSIRNRLYGDRVDGGPVTKIIDVYISKLKPKLPPGSIKLAWGIGYRLTETGLAAYDAKRLARTGAAG